MSNAARAYDSEILRFEPQAGQRKKSGNPTQPGNRSTARSTTRRKKPKTILQRAARIFKRLNWGRIALLLLAGVGLWNIFAGLFFPDTPATDTELPPIAAVTPEATPTEGPTYIFRDGDGYPLDMQAMTNAWAAEAGFEKRYELTDEERLVVAQVVTAEAGGEPYAGMVAVAQCILQAAEDDGIRPDEVVLKYGYTKRRPEPTTEAMEAVADVFDFGNVATGQPIKYFYAPAWTDSEWHESQVYVMTINGHRFFKEATEE